MSTATSALLALHYQNENCHPDGRIKVGIARDAPWREERLANARRLFAGVSTAYVVEGSVRHATDLGYECTVVSDACSTATQRQHHNALEAMSLLAEIATVDQVLAALPAGTPETRLA